MLHVDCSSSYAYKLTYLSFFWQEALKNYCLVFDAIYTPKWTRLLTEAQESGAAVVFGTEMFLNQAFVQVEKFSGLPGKFNKKDLTILVIFSILNTRFNSLPHHVLYLNYSPMQQTSNWSGIHWQETHKEERVSNLLVQLILCFPVAA